MFKKMIFINLDIVAINKGEYFSYMFRGVDDYGVIESKISQGLVL